jgi:hypothetical protein
MRGKRRARLVAAAVLACATAATVSGVMGSSNAAATMGGWRITSVWGAAAAFESVVNIGPASTSFNVAGDGGSGVWLDGRPIWTGSSVPGATGSDATSSV